MRRTVKGGKPGGSAPGAGTGAPSWYGPGMQTPDLTRSHLPFSWNAMTVSVNPTASCRDHGHLGLHANHVPKFIGVFRRICVMYRQAKVSRTFQRSGGARVLDRGICW